ncbi:hypothetical protein M0811_06431 [Anaeramoeba ignava]|uniref:Uncharacterized protein n=1 Tax=Anaeramoeba ignava TaxID=1746090 RepID=A0A9Q0LMT2_ANAIG|nr:hypothetical protein M0811_06431 [Anaeramoeba ignava]
MKFKNFLFITHLFLLFFAFGNEEEVNLNKEAKFPNEMRDFPLFNSAEDYEWIKTFTILPDSINSTDNFGISPSIFGNSFLVGNSYYNQKHGEVFFFQNNGTNWNQKQILIANDGQANDSFGYLTYLSENLALIGAPYADIGDNKFQGKAYVFENNGTYWNEKQILFSSEGRASDWFGTSGVIVLEILLKFLLDHLVHLLAIMICKASEGESGDEFGWSIDIQGDILVISAYFAKIGSNNAQGKVYIFQNNGTNWNQKQILIASDGGAYDHFGAKLSISGNFLLISSPYATIGDNIQQGKAYIFENNGTYWNQKQILFASDGQKDDFFGMSVSVSGNVSFIGVPGAQIGSNDKQGKVYVYINNGTFWNENQILNLTNGNTDDYFSYFLALSSNFSVVSSTEEGGKSYIFEPFLKPPAVDILNCSSLFSSFDCYWNQINSSLNDIEYQIFYQTDVQNWQLIQSPILIQNVFYQVFNSSFYPNITGNVDYSIQIKSCNTTTTACSDPSNQINLKTRIDSVKNLSLGYISGESIQLNWNYPNVPIINSTAKLNHYLLSYQIQDSNQSTNISISNSSTSFQINNLQSLTNYLISICGCRTEQCLGEDQGEISTIQTQTSFGSVLNLSCSVSNSFEISCTWEKPNDSIDPTYYNFTYQSQNANDSGNYSLNVTNQDFIAQYSNQEYQINVSACDSNQKCGTISTFQITTPIFGPVLNLSCSVSNSFEISCTWEKPNDSIDPTYYNFTYQSQNANDSGNYSLNVTNQDFIAQYSNQEYQISVSACDSNFECGDISTITINTGVFGPVLNFSCSVSDIYNISCTWDKPNDSLNPTYYNFTYQAISENDSGNYSINSTFLDFTSKYSNEEYQINVSACDSNFECGDISTITINTGVFGPVLNFSCSVSDIYNISCTWDKPNDSFNPTYYNFTYQAISENDSGNYSINSTFLDFTSKYSNEEYQINVSACDSHNQCGDISTITINTGVFGPVLNFSCSVSDIYNISCSWNKPNDSFNPTYYNFTYQAISENDSGNYSINSTFLDFTSKYSNEYYQINVSACDSNFECGYISTITINTGVFGPVLNFSCSVSDFYLISCTWNKPNDSFNPTYYNFTYQAISENDSGNYSINSTFLDFTSKYSNEYYQINVSACDSNFECGDISTTQIETGIFGPVLNLYCVVSNIYDISCSWDQPNGPVFPTYYNFTYQSIYQNDIGNLLSNGSNQVFTAKYSNEVYLVKVSACIFNGCGILSSYQIRTQEKSTSSSNSKTTTIVLSTVIPVVAIVGIVLAVVLIKKKRKKQINKQNEIEIDEALLDGNDD